MFRTSDQKSFSVGALEFYGCLELWSIIAMHFVQYCYGLMLVKAKDKTFTIIL